MSRRQLPDASGTSLAAALATGLLASACCAGPLILALIGVGGAWISDLTRLDPWRPWLTAAALGSLAFAHYRYWRPQRAISCDCAVPARGGRALSLWLATLAVLAAIALPYVLPYLVLPGSV